MTCVRIASCSSSRTGVSRLASLLAALLLASPAAGDPYRIGPGDVLDLQVWREADISGLHEVDADGALHHALLGDIAASGKTVEELAEALRAGLEKDYLRDARVLVTLEKSARRKAWMLGAVGRPGSYPVEAGARVLDLLFAADGLAANSDGSAKFYRMGEPGPEDPPVGPSEREPLAEFDLDLAALLGGDLAANRVVEAGDVIVVSGTPGAVAASGIVARVRIVGEVARPGSYPLGDASTALDAVLAAGGFTEYASSNRARLVRGDGEDRTEQRLRLGDIAAGKKGAENVELEAGDLIFVPESFF